MACACNSRRSGGKPLLLSNAAAWRSVFHACIARMRSVPCLRLLSCPVFPCILHQLLRSGARDERYELPTAHAAVGMLPCCAACAAVFFNYAPKRRAERILRTSCKMLFIMDYFRWEVSHTDFLNGLEEETFFSGRDARARFSELKSHCGCSDVRLAVSLNGVYVNEFGDEITDNLDFFMHHGNGS